MDCSLKLYIYIHIHIYIYIYGSACTGRWEWHGVSCLRGRSSSNGVFNVMRYCSLMQALQAGWRAKVEDPWWGLVFCGWCCCGRTRQLEGSPFVHVATGMALSEELFPGLTLVVYYDDDVYWHERLVLWKLSDSVEVKDRLGLGEHSGLGMLWDWAIKQCTSHLWVSVFPRDLSLKFIF